MTDFLGCYKKRLPKC